MKKSRKCIQSLLFDLIGNVKISVFVVMQVKCSLYLWKEFHFSEVCPSVNYIGSHAK